MLKIWRPIMLGFVLSLLPLGAGAAVWTARDLGTTDSEAACVDRAEHTMRIFANTFGAADLRRGAWMVALDKPKGDALYALITCTHDGRRTRGTLVIWSPDDGINRVLVANRLSRLFQGITTSKPNAGP